MHRCKNGSNNSKAFEIWTLGMCKGLEYKAGDFFRPSMIVFTIFELLSGYGLLHIKI